MGNREGNDWQPDQIDTLTREWSTHTASEIGVMINKTRNAVIGKAARLTLPRKKEAPRRSGTTSPRERVYVERPKREYERTRVSRERLKVPPIPPPEPIPGGIGIMELENVHCRAVIGRGPDDLARFCGAPKLAPHSYCAGHAALYFNPNVFVLR